MGLQRKVYPSYLIYKVSMAGITSLSNTNSCEESIIKLRRSSMFAEIRTVVCVTLCCTFADLMLYIVL